MRAARAHGFTLIEQLLLISILIVILTIALPVTSDTMDAMRTATATRYLASRITNARMEAIKRSTQFALRFEAGAGDYTYWSIMDGNGNGVRTADITQGIDRTMDQPERIGDNFANVRLGLIEGIPDADGAMNTGTDGVRIGSARLLSLSPNGTATAGTIYVRGRGAQYAIRVLGVTARVRVLQYVRGEGKWINR